MNLKKTIAITLLTANLYSVANAQQNGDPKATEVWQPVRTVATAPITETKPPSDAIVLFDGKNLSEWCSTNDTTKAAAWTLSGNTFIVKKGTGNIQTKKKFTDYQLHIEWQIPENITGSGQARGNSGVFLASTGGGNDGYEMQVLDNYNNETYANGQAGSIYKQAIPLVNACKHPGEWQSYDIVWKAPRFTKKGKLKSPASVNAFQNGVLVQDNFQLKGETMYIGKPSYKAHGATSIKLQDHGDPSEPISFRNIWVREL